MNTYRGPDVCDFAETVRYRCTGNKDNFQYKYFVNFNALPHDSNFKPFHLYKKLEGTRYK